MFWNDKAQTASFFGVADASSATCCTIKAIEF